MNHELVTKMFELVINLSTKPKLMGPELTVYFAGLTFVENQYRLYNIALETGIDELRERDNDEDWDTAVNITSHPDA